MFAKLESVIAPEEDQRIVEQAPVFELLADGAHALIDRHQGSAVVAIELVEIRSLVVHAIDAVPGIALPPHPVGTPAIVLLVIRQRFRFRNRHVRVEMLVPFGRQKLRPCATCR